MGQRVTCHSLESVIYSSGAYVTLLLRVQFFNACCYFLRSLATCHVTLVIPVCSEDISGRLEFILFYFFEMFISTRIPQSMRRNERDMLF
jgi:hypothetical protein